MSDHPPPSSDGPAARARRAYNSIAGRDVDRALAITDAVFAVAMTLLVLDLRLPNTSAHSDAQLISQLVALLPHLAAYVLSFLMLGTFWLAVHTLLALSRASDRGLQWSVLSFNFFVTLLPFTATVLAEHFTLRSAVLLYWANLAALGGTLAWVLAQVWPHAKQNALDGLTLIRRRLIFAQILYLVAAGLSAINPRAGLFSFLVFQLFFIVSPRTPWRI